MTFLDLQTKRHRDPFKPFKIRMADNTVYSIKEPWMILVGETSAVVVTEVRKDDRGYKIAMHWRTIAIADIVELSDTKSKQERSKRKRA